MIHRLMRLILKELQAILGNTQGRLLLVFPIVMQTVLFPFAATLEVKNSTLVVYNEDSGATGRELLERLARTAAFTQVVMVHSDAALATAIEQQSALLGVHLPADLSRKLVGGQDTAVQVVIDGRRSNAGQIASGYVGQVVRTLNLERNGGAAPSVTLRHLYNPNLDGKWHVLPSLVAIITTIGCLIVTALSVAREREEGTFDQLLVSPLTPAYIMAGKAVPGVLVAMAQGAFIALAARFGYGVPFSGSIPLLFVGMLSYGLALAGVGLFISSISATQQQAFLGVFSFMVPAVILSGYVAPIDNMPLVLQWIAHIDPLTYFIRLLKGVFLKDFGLAQGWPQLWPLWLISLCTLGLALSMFRRQTA